MFDRVNADALKPDATNEPSLWVRLIRLAAILITICAVAFISVVPQVANDFWLQAKVGEIIAQTHEIPKTLLFPFTEVRDASFNAHEWLASVLFYWLIHAVGEDGLPLVMGLAGIGLFCLMTWLAYRKSDKNLPVAMLLGLLAVGVENYRHFLRPELLSLLLMGLYWHLLETCRSKSNVWAWSGALLVVVLWANMHGSFILAPIIAAVYAVGLSIDIRLGLSVSDESGSSGPRAYAIFSVATVAASLINPFGVELLEFVWNFSRSEAAKALVAEWLPTFDPRLRQLRGLWIGLACIGVTAAVMLVRRRRLSAVEVLLFLMFLALALKTIRFLVYPGMVAAFVLAPLVPISWQTQRNLTRAYVAVAGLGAMVLGLAIQFGNAFGAYPHQAWRMNTSFTYAMARYLDNPSFSGNVINSYELGAELVYRAYPRLRPSIDSRIDSYGGEYTQLNARLFLEEETLTEFVKDYDVRYMLLTHNDFQYLKKLSNWTQNRWTIRMMDQRAVFLQRSDLLQPP